MALRVFPASLAVISVLVPRRNILGRPEIIIFRTNPFRPVERAISILKWLGAVSSVEIISNGNGSSIS